MTTALDIINLALFDAGVIGQGQVASAQDANNAFTRLNFMIGEWQTQRWLIWGTVDISKVSTGAQSYTVGPGGDFNVSEVPDRLEAAFFRQLVQSQPNQIDYPLELLQSREDYNNIALKNLVSFPQNIFFDPQDGVTLGRVYPWPIPSPAIYEVHITLKRVLSEFLHLNDAVQLPIEYYNALHWNMAVRLRSAYDLPPKPMDVALAKKSLEVIRGANAAIARLTMPTDLIRPGIYNPYSDQIR
jgi:hypothetical protein